MKGIVRRPNGERRFLAFAAALSLISALVVGLFVRLDPDVSALLPTRGEAANLSRYLTVFGGGGLSVVLVTGDDPEAVAQASSAITEQLLAEPEVGFARDRIGHVEQPDPLLLWRNADAAARGRLAAALTPAGMRERLTETRQLLLAPGAGASSEAIQKDPLRLAELMRGDAAGVSVGFVTREDGAFATADGRARLVVVKPRGQALRGADARGFVAAAERAMASARTQQGVSVGLTGPHAVAAQMEVMLRRDLSWLGVLATVLASLAFVVVYRRPRAILAILIPLGLGTLWTTSLAALWPNGLSAIAVAFTSVVVGVGFDSGVHVYSALLDARRRGVAPAEAAAEARARVARPVLVAATIAALAFACLSLSSIEALRQFGLLCAAGELLTAIAVLLVTPALGAWLERGTPPKSQAAAFQKVAVLTRTKTRAALTIGGCALLALSVTFSGVKVGDSLVAVRPSGLQALEVEKQIFQLFGGQAQPFVVMVEDSDRDAALARADVLAEALAAHPMVLRVDGLSTLVPAEATQRARLAERDALGLSDKAIELEAALREVGFAPARFSGLLAAMRQPPSEVAPVEDRLRGDASAIAARHLASADGKHYATVHVHLDAPNQVATLQNVVSPIDPAAMVTGYARLEQDLRAALATDLPRVGGLALVLVVALLGFSLRKPSRVAIALSALVLGILLLLSLVGFLGVPLHIYSALVIPVLLGISVDEAMFLLHGVDDAKGDPVEHSLGAHGPAVVTTALTTSAGFIALSFASYDGLRDLGRVGALGNVAVLLTSLLLVPAGLRLVARKRA